MFIDTNTCFSFIHFTTENIYYGFLLTCCLMNTTVEKKTYRLPITPHSESILIVILWHLTDCFPFSSVTTTAGADGLPGRAARRETHTQSLKSDTHNAVCQEGINGVH